MPRAGPHVRAHWTCLACISPLGSPKPKASAVTGRYAHTCTCKYYSLIPQLSFQLSFLNEYHTFVNDGRGRARYIYSCRFKMTIKLIYFLANSNIGG